ncbi:MULTISPECIES: glycerol-3-phosphate ABC transporter substrate-binding protein [unclassified Microcoleus]|uniref:glycerol-3-phosphate ABC transporter substrate-binding protein n=1 Tax=unclassified Microcoleus TaxID=2642155 RepID=UPI002FCE77D4
MLTSYKPDVFDSLEHFFTARDLLEQAQDNMTELGAIIRSYGLQKQVGICLLHKHFDLADNERLVEEFDGHNAYVKPTAEYGDAIPYMWKVEKDRASGNWVWFPLEFVRVSEAVSAAIKRSEAVVNNSEFLNEIAGKLSDLGMTDMFGISILHRDAIKVAEGEILVESTDDEARVLTLSSVPRQDVDRATLTQTLWQFPNDEGVEVGAMCSHCTHCTHCTH